MSIPKNIALALVALTSCGQEDRDARSEARGLAAKVSDQPQSLAEAGEDVYFEGPANAPVTIIVAFDYQCPYCRKHDETLERLRATFPNEVRIGVKHLPLPFHKHAREAAIAAEAARDQGRFSEMSKVMMSRQSQISPESLDAWAAELGLDMKRFDAARKSPAVALRVDAQMRSAQAAGAKGTPSSWINGKLIVGARPYGDLEREILTALGRPVPAEEPAAEPAPGRGCAPGDASCKPPKGC